MMAGTTRLDWLRGLFEYEDWANARVLVFLEGRPDDRRLLDIFGHLIAESLPWLCLLRGEPVPEALECAPHWSVGDCRANLASVQARLSLTLDRLAEGDLDAPVASPEPAGRTFSNTVIEVLTHLLTHGQHHRGQIEGIAEHETGTYLATSYMPYLRQRSGLARTG